MIFSIIIYCFCKNIKFNQYLVTFIWKGTYIPKLGKNQKRGPKNALFFENYQLIPFFNERNFYFLPPIFIGFF